MTARTDDITRSRTRTRRAAVALGAAFTTLALGAGVASAQTGGTTSPTPVAPAPAPASGGPTLVFPVPGPHTFGDGFGADRGGRSHQGVDIFAACGSPLVSVAKGRVVLTGSQSSAGNYLVIRAKKPFPRDYVYMHMQGPATVLKKQKVMRGQSVGAVGDTGNASGCHLHFEIWKGKWYRGGRALDPMPSLLEWDTYS